MEVKSKTALFKLLSELTGKTDIRIGKYSISDETYGRRSFLYFYNIETEWGYSRKMFESLLTRWGFKCNPRWYKEADATEVQVSYFKGYHWDE